MRFMSTTKKAAAKKKPNRQHAAKGQAFIDFAHKLREASEGAIDPNLRVAYRGIATIAQEVGEETRRKR